MGLNQTEAAKLAGWKSQQHWAYVESGEHADPRISTLVKVARVLKCTVPDLLIEERK